MGCVSSSPAGDKKTMSAKSQSDGGEEPVEKKQKVNNDTTEVGDVDVDVASIDLEKLKMGAYVLSGGGGGGGDGDGDSDVKTVYLAGAIAPPDSVQVSRPDIIGQAGATFSGTPDEFLAARTDDVDEVTRQMKNKVKKCPQCGKAVAFTLDNCNQCGTDITTIEIGHSNNIFSGFVYGIQKGPFPFTISLRSEDSDFMVFDDLLALAPCHLNVIPTSHYLPDWRYLLHDPARGLKLLETMYDRCFQVFKTQFWANDAWRRRYMSFVDDETYTSITDDELRSCIAAGFNYPPSQYQLHLQFMVYPLLPFHYHLYLRGTHYTPGRFFPYEYAIQVLRKGIAMPDIDDATPIQSIIDKFSTLGIDYSAIHQEQYQRYASVQERLGKYDVGDFTGVVIDGRYQTLPGSSSSSSSSSNDGDSNDEIVKKLTDADKLTLQAYGRPYNVENGRPTGVYYQHAKTSAKDFPMGL